MNEKMIKNTVTINCNCAVGGSAVWEVGMNHCLYSDYGTENKEKKLTEYFSDQPEMPIYRRFMDEMAKEIIRIKVK